jgi:hypothetical protein
MPGDLVVVAGGSSGLSGGRPTRARDLLGDLRIDISSSAEKARRGSPIAWSLTATAIARSMSAG